MKTGNMFGIYKFTGRLDAADFFQLNIPLMAALFGIENREVEVICGNGGTSGYAILIGTQRTPMTRGGRVEITSHRLRVFCNLAVIIPTLEQAVAKGGEQATVLLASTLWGFVAKAFRLYLIVEGEIGPEELLPLKMLARYHLAGVKSALLGEYVDKTWPAGEMKKQIDTEFISGFISLLIVYWATKGGSFDFAEVARIIKETKRSCINLPAFC
jgi:hypothetical protein